MPAFMFEKISSPVRCGSVTPELEKSHGLFRQIISCLGLMLLRLRVRDSGTAPRDEAPAK
ncbi:MAG: hypothetical protein FWD68_14410 [Alphaproteobacteria bacterium]|nr:hypothetical protein [Alphaproteobacteria bacterium]